MRALAFALLLIAAAASAQPAAPLGLDPLGLLGRAGLDLPARPAAPGASALATGDWSPVGDVNPAGSDGTIYAVAEANDGTVIVGGEFSEVYGVAANNLATYDPTTETWSALPVSLSGGTGGSPVVYALAVVDSYLVIGGDFTSADGVGAVPNLVGYNPAAGAFVSLGSPWPATAVVKALFAGPNGALFVGGHGTPVASGDPPSGGLMLRYPGSGTWADLGAGLDEDDAVQAIQPDPANNRVWVGGDFDQIGGVGGPGALYFASYSFAGGGVWEPVPGIPSAGSIFDGVRAFALAPDGALYVGGFFKDLVDGTYGRLAVYDTDAETWSSLGHVNFWVNDLALAGDGRLYIGGNLSASGAFDSRHFAVYDPSGDTWTPLDVGTRPHAVTATSSGVLVAGEEGGAIQRWTGTTWEFLGPTRFDTNPYAATSAPDGTIYAVGAFGTTPDGIASGVAAFDGTAWHPVGGGITEPRFGPTATGYDAEVGPDGRLYVGGDFARAGGVEVAGFAAWDGTAWDPLGAGVAQFISPPFLPLIRNVTFAPDGTLYVGVTTYTSEVLSDPGPALVLKWDGVSWSQVGDIDRLGSVLDLLLGSDGTLYAAGQFFDGDLTEPTGDQYGVLAYDGVDWERIDADLVADLGPIAVYSMTELPDGRILASVVADPAPTTPMYAWDGTSWSPFGANLIPTSIGADMLWGADGSLYMAGQLGGIDGAVVFYGLTRLEAATEEWVAADGFTTSQFEGFVLGLGETPDGRLLLAPLDAGISIRLNGVEVDGLIQSEPLAPPAQAYAVTGPAALGAYAHGDAVNVEWTTLDPAHQGDPVRVAVLCPGQDPWVRYASTADDGKAGFAVPASLGAHGGVDDQAPGCVVEVANAADPSRAAVSAPFVVSGDGVGSVTTRKLDLSTPRTPARYGLGDVVKWFWDATTVPAGHTVRVALVCDGRDRWVRYADTENDGQAGAALPANFGAYEVCRAEITSIDDTALFGRSDPFEVLDTALPSVDVLTPAEDDVITMGTDLEIMWETEAVGAGATVRILLVDQTNGPPNRLVARTTNTGSYTWSVPTDLDPAAEYKLSVKVTAEDGTFPFALVDPLTFVAAPPVASAGASAAAEEALPEALEVGAARPNPARSVATVRLGVPEAGPVEVAVYDAVGRRVAVLASGERSVGWHALTVEAGRLAPGVYVVRAVGGGAVATRTLTVVR